MIQTTTGMHVRRVVALDEANGTAVVRSYGHPTSRMKDRPVSLSELREETPGEIRRAFERHQANPVDDGMR